MANRVDALHVSALTVGSVALPSSCVVNANVAPGAAIGSAKLVHRHVLRYSQKEGSNAASETHPIFIASASGQVLSVEAVITGQVPSVAVGSSGYYVTIDLKKSTGGGAFATILAATLQANSTRTLREKFAATLDTATFVAGDVLQLVCTAGGSSGDQVQGFAVIIKLEENPA